MPIASEDYGDMSMKFKVVAVARKTDKHTTLFNMKGNNYKAHYFKSFVFSARS